MDNELITKQSEQAVTFLKTIDRLLDKLECTLADCWPMLKGEHYLTDRELSDRLKISRRTLQDYRNAGRIPYYQIGGKILYRESDIKKLLDENHNATLPHHPLTYR